MNAEIIAFTLDHIFVNTEISAFPNLNTSVIFVNAEISAFTNIPTLWMQIYLHSQICGRVRMQLFMHSHCFMISECRYFCIHIISRLVNADISAFSVLTHYEFRKLILSKLHYTCIFTCLSFNWYYEAYDSTFYGIIF